MNNPKSPVFVHRDESGIILYQKSSTTSYIKYVLADGTGNLIAGNLLTVYRQKFKNSTVDEYYVFLPSKIENNNISPMAGKKQLLKPALQTEPGLYILVNEKSIKHPGLEAMFPGWSSFLEFTDENNLGQAPQHARALAESLTAVEVLGEFYENKQEDPDIDIDNEYIANGIKSDDKDQSDRDTL